MKAKGNYLEIEIFNAICGREVAFMINLSIIILMG